MKCRGFSIWEMLVVIILMGAVGVILPRAFTGTMRVVREAPAASNAIATSHAMLDTLRPDVWSANETAAAADGQSLRISVAGRQVNWTVRSLQTDNGPAIEVMRVSGDERRSWNLAAVTMRFEPSPAGVLVRFGPPPAGDDSILLVSELARLNRASEGAP
jgi:hypothetical protein